MDDAPRKGNKERERYEVFEKLEDWLIPPVIVLGVVWLVSVAIDFIWGLNAFLNTLMYLIWGVFVMDFIITALNKRISVRGYSGGKHPSAISHRYRNAPYLNL